MADYQSRYTGQEIDSGIAKANTSIQSSDLATVATSGSYNDLSNKPDEVTESTVSGWGFTKNTGTYSKPSGGIPKTDLASAVQTSLGKADTALQSISSSDVTSALGYTPYNSTNPNGYTSNVGTITGINMNGSSKGTSGVVDLGTVITDVSDKEDKFNPENYLQTIGYESGRLNATGGEVSHSTMHRSKFIPCEKSDTVIVKGITLAPAGTSGYICFYDENKNFLSNAGTANIGVKKREFANINYEDNFTTMIFPVSDVIGDGETLMKTKYMRFSCTTINENSSCIVIPENKDFIVREQEETEPINYLEIAGHHDGYRLNSSGNEVSYSNMTVINNIPCTKNDKVTINNIVLAPPGTTGYLCFYDTSGTFVKYIYTLNSDSSGSSANGITYSNNHTTMQFTINDSLVGEGIADKVASFKVSLTSVSENGECFIESETTEEKVATEKLAYIRGWTKPIFDTSQPYLLNTDIEAMNNFDKTPSAVYAKYQELCDTYPEWITATDLGVCSDGETHIWRYDLRCPEERRDDTHPHSQELATGLIVSGIHTEYMGIYSLYSAIRQIITDPELAWLRNNIHLIIIPVANPYCCIPENYNVTNGRKNYRGVEIHRNFSVGWQSAEESGFGPGTNNYGGSKPLSEIESITIDKIIKDNQKNLSFVLSCHNFDYSGGGNTNFIWTSAGTAYTNNIGARLIEKMSSAWNKKYDLSVGINKYKGDLPAWDNRLGKASMSPTGGTEYRHATKYGIQGLNIEVVYQFLAHCPASTTSAEDLTNENMSSFSMSRACEAYINAIITLFSNYDIHDKDKFWK